MKYGVLAIPAVQRFLCWCGYSEDAVPPINIIFHYLTIATFVTTPFFPSSVAAITM